MLKAFVLLSVFQVIFGLPTSGTPENGTIYAKQTDGPWTVLLIISGTRCTGSLIKNKYVVTAAHCFDDLEDFESLQNEIKIFIGEWKIGMDPDCTDSDEDSSETDDICFPGKVSEIKPKRLTIHPDDIAIIELKRPARLSKIIQIIALPSKDTCDKEPDHPLFVTGFGDIKPKQYTNMKKLTNIYLYDHATCKRMLGNVFNEEKHFCGMGSNNLKTCRGDSGGPIANIINGVPTLQGVVTRGSPQCAYGSIPYEFLRVACYIDWINDHTTEDSRRPITTKNMRKAASDEDDDDPFF